MEASLVSKYFNASARSHNKYYRSKNYPPMSNVEGFILGSFLWCNTILDGCQGHRNATFLYSTRSLNRFKRIGGLFGSSTEIVRLPPMASI